MSLILPDSLYQRVPRGRFQPCIHGVMLTVYGAGLVTADGPSEAALREQLDRCLGTWSRAGIVLQATLTSPDGVQRSVEISNRPIDELPLFALKPDAA
jgi:hypothetical protein